MHKPILKKLRAYRSQIRAGITVGGVSWTVVVVVGLVFLSLGIDYTQRMNLAGRVFSLCVGGCVIAYVAHRALIRKLLRPMGDERIALTVEDRFPELRDRVISSLQFAGALQAGSTGRSDESLAMMSAVTSDAVAAIQPLRLGRTIDAGKLGRAAGGALLGCVALGAMCFTTVQGRNVMGLWFQRNILLADVAWPQRTYLEVAYKPVIPRGDALTVSVRATGVVPDRVQIDYEWKSGRSGEESLSRVGARDSSRFEMKFKNVVEELEFRVSGGDARTERYQVALVERPSITQLRFWAVYPYYTRIPPKLLREAESFFEVLPGTTLRVAAVSSKELRSARLVLNDEEKGVAMVAIHGEAGEAPETTGERWTRRGFWFTEAEQQKLPAGRNLWAGSLGFTENCSVAVKVVDVDGLDNRPPTRFTVRIVPDKEPTVALRMVGIGEMIVPNATLPLDLRVTDDFGVKSLCLRHHFVIGDKSSIQKPEDEDVLPLEEDVVFGGREVTYKKGWNLSSLGLVTGSVFKFHAEATDTKDPEPANVGRTEEFTLRVVAPDELMADLVRRQVEQSQEFLRIRERQNDEVKIEIDSGEAAARKKGTLTDEEERRLGAAADTVRHSAEEVKQVARALEQVFLEMVNNKLGEPEERSKLKNDIVDPCTELAEKLMPELAAGIRPAGAAEGAELKKQLAALVRQDDAVLEQMDRVLGSMLKMRTFRLIVEQIRRLKNEQEEVFVDIDKRLAELLLESSIGPSNEKPK